MYVRMWYTIRLLHTPCDQLQLLLLLLLFVPTFGIFFSGTAALRSQAHQTLACPCKPYMYTFTTVSGLRTTYAAIAMISC